MKLIVDARAAIKKNQQQKRDRSESDKGIRRAVANERDFYD